MTDQKPLELSFAKHHDILQGPRGNGRMGATYVMSRCSHPTFAFYDEVSKQRFPNVASLKAAMARGGRFHLAVQCEKHRWLEQCPDDIVAELVALQAQQVSS